MKQKILGFNQNEAIKLGLSIEDLLFLRWFIDTKESLTDDILYIIKLDIMGYFPEYKKTIEDLPIIFQEESLEKNIEKLKKILKGNLSKILYESIEPPTKNNFLVSVNHEIYKQLID